MDLLEQHFAELSPSAREQLANLERVFREWNERINLVSRKDIDQFVLHHLVHSLALTKFVQFPERCRILDVGTGGGLPGMPLAICNPSVQVFLCDSIQKKAKAVDEMAKSLGLKNVQVVNKRAEQLESRWDYVLGRAVTSLPTFLGWVRGNISAGESGGLPHGVFYWKGSLYQEELASVGLEPHAVFDIGSVIADPYFSEKYIIQLTREQILQADLPEVVVPAPAPKKKKARRSGKRRR